MALGKVTTINSDNISGTITEDESGQTYGFSDKDFPSSGLQVNSPCTYEINYADTPPIATKLAAYTPTETDITTPVSGPITVNSGETLRVKNGGVITGSVVVNNGNLFVQGTGQVNGDVSKCRRKCIVKKVDYGCCCKQVVVLLKLKMGND